MVCRQPDERRELPVEDLIKEAWAPTWSTDELRGDQWVVEPTWYFLYGSPDEPWDPQEKLRDGVLLLTMQPHSRTPTTGKLDSTPMRAAPPPPPRPSGDLLPGAEVVQAEAGK